MYLIEFIIRPEKVQAVSDALAKIGIVAMTRMPVIGRGKQSGLKVGDILYKDLPKELVKVAVRDDLKNEAIKAIMEAARTGKGNHGDGRVFVIPVAEAYTIRTGEKDS